MSFGPEWDLVERPLLEHLTALGWETLVWSERQPTENVARLSDRDVLLEQRLRSALVKINRGPNRGAVARRGSDQGGGCGVGFDAAGDQVARGEPVVDRFVAGWGDCCGA